MSAAPKPDQHWYGRRIDYMLAGVADADTRGRWDISRATFARVRRDGRAVDIVAGGFSVARLTKDQLRMLLTMVQDRRQEAVARQIVAMKRRGKRR